MTLLFLFGLLFSQAEPPADTLTQPAQPPPEPVTNLRAYDYPNDPGKQIILQWNLSPDDESLNQYVLYRKQEGGQFEEHMIFAPGLDSTADTIQVENFTPYVYKIASVRGDQQSFSATTGTVEAAGQWFNTFRINVLVAMIVFFSLVLIFTTQAKRGKKLFLRKIAGLEAIDEAVGRATEMGRPILFVPGLSTISDIATIAALNILQGIARKAAQYDTPLIVPNRDPIVYTVTREIVKEAYSDVGRPDAWDPDSTFYLSSDQFAYVSGVNGIMLRERPAANFFLGMFWAESLILAETGYTSGAIQIAGTDAAAQLPFFITACDYTIIGEELYAASAYIAREPNLLGTVKAQDWSKAIMVILLGLLTVIALAGATTFALSILTTV